MSIGKIIRPILLPFAMFALALIHLVMIIRGERCKSELPVDDPLAHGLRNSGVPMPITCVRIACHFGRCRGVVWSPKYPKLEPGKAYWDTPIETADRRPS